MSGINGAASFGNAVQGYGGMPQPGPPYHNNPAMTPGPHNMQHQGSHRIHSGMPPSAQTPGALDHPRPQPYPAHPGMQPSPQVGQKRKLEADAPLNPHQPQPPHAQQTGPSVGTPTPAPEAPSANATQPAEKKLRPPMPPPHLLASLVPESKLFSELLDMEGKFDWLMLRKRAEAQEGLGRVGKIKRMLRIYISNTAYNQAWQRDGTGMTEPNFETGEGIPGWTLNVEGRVIDTNNSRIDKFLKRKFSTLVKTMIVELGDRGPATGDEGHIIEYHNRQTQPQPGVDGFEIKRRGDAPVKVRVILHLDHYPERFKVLEPLASLIAMAEGTRNEALLALWKFIKLVGAQDRDDATRLLGVGGLERLFDQEKTIPFVALPELIGRYLTHPEPVVLTYDLRVDKERSINPVVFDVPFEVEDPIKSKMHTAVQMLESGTIIKGLMDIEDEVAALAHQIRSAREKKDFLSAFAHDPANFINKWLASQARDLDLILGNEIGIPGTNGGLVREEDLRRSDLFRMPWVEEAVTVKEGVRLAREADTQREIAMRQAREKEALRHQPR